MFHNIKPRKPKNGDVYKDDNGNLRMFRFGQWVSKKERITSIFDE